MLALATTTVTVAGRAPGAAGPTDAHGAPLPSTGVTRGPFPAHRRPNVVVLTAAGTEARGAVWYLDPAAWPVTFGDTITDDTDGTTWSVEGAQRIPVGLGLEQVQADCTQAP